MSAGDPVSERRPPGPTGSKATAARLAGAAGLFVLGLVAVPVALLGGAYLLDTIGVVDGAAALAVLFLAVGVPAIAVTISRRLRPLGIGATLGIVLCGLLVLFYAVVLQATDF